MIAGNQGHQSVIVAATRDGGMKRVVAHPTERGIPIDALPFQIFAYGAERLISRACLIDPVGAQVSSATTPGDPSESWNGEFYGSIGHGESRSWEVAVEHGFICAGRGAGTEGRCGCSAQEIACGSGCQGPASWASAAWGARPIRHGLRVVTTPAGDAPVLEVATRANYHREFVGDPERSEYFVPERWLQTVPLEGAVDEVGLFGNQNPVCKPTIPRWRSTVERSKERFPGFGSDGA